jgi:hypothetical protein
MARTTFKLGDIEINFGDDAEAEPHGGCQSPDCVTCNPAHAPRPVEGARLLRCLLTMLEQAATESTGIAEFANTWIWRLVYNPFPEHIEREILESIARKHADAHRRVRWCDTQLAELSGFPRELGELIDLSLSDLQSDLAEARAEHAKLMHDAESAVPSGTA